MLCTVALPSKSLCSAPGVAVVTKGKASLWTDSRYWTQAERQMDCNWELHKEGRRFLGKVQVRGYLQGHSGLL